VFAAAAAGVIGTLLLLSVLSAGLSSINHPSPSSVADISYGFASTSNGAASADLAQLETAQFGEEAGSDYFTAEASIENNLISQDFPTGKSILNTANGNSAFRYTFRIDLTVSDLSNAVSILQGMNGYTMNSEINQTSGYASITRRIDLSAYENAKTVLRNIGEIDHEEESSELLSGQQLELNAQLTAKRQEQARLLQLLGKSASIDVLTKVESQLSGVENTADRLQGQLNAIIDEANQPYLVVYIHTKSVVSVSGALSFGSRISNSFKRSYNGVQSFLEGALIFSVGAAMPLLLLVLFVVIVLLLFRRILKRGGKA
jgi:vacuolar-type H+-ATPase subunit E/Vma4